jgi:hypothetical protein
MRASQSNALKFHSKNGLRRFGRVKRSNGLVRKRKPRAADNEGRRPNVVPGKAPGRVEIRGVDLDLDRAPDRTEVRVADLEEPAAVAEDLHGIADQVVAAGRQRQDAQRNSAGSKGVAL